MLSLSGSRDVIAGRVDAYFIAIRGGGGSDEPYVVCNMTLDLRGGHAAKGNALGTSNICCLGSSDSTRLSYDLR